MEALTDGEVKRRTLKRMILRYTNACVEESWIGGSHPSTHEHTINERKVSKRKLYNYINEVLFDD